MDIIQVIGVTMHQNGFEKIKEMNIKSDIVLANQADCYKFEQLEFNNHLAKLVTTNTRGVGINRNIAIMHSNADILLFADEDVVYEDDYVEKITKAFAKFPEADVILFKFKISKNGQIIGESRCENGRVRTYNAMRYGTYQIAIRKCSLDKANIWFSEIFGCGTKYGGGEDSLFILDCLRSRLKVYSCGYTIGVTYKDNSTWFSGYNEKYFFDKGAWIAAAFPKARIIKYYFAIKLSKLTNLKFKGCLKYMNAGIKGFKTLSLYDDYASLGNK